MSGQAPFFLDSDRLLHELEDLSVSPTPDRLVTAASILSSPVLSRAEMMTMKRIVSSVLLLSVMIGCGDDGSTDPYSDVSGSDVEGYTSYYGADEIMFLDEASTNATLDGGLTSVSFVTADGEERFIRDLAPGKTVVVVVTRGNTVPICPYCSTQTARLISSYKSFQKLGAEVAVVYPVETGDDSVRLNSFLDEVKTRLDDPGSPVPFPVLLDVELKGVDKLGIRKDLSKPATYIIDSEGNVRYAYVGEHIADRPSVTALLAEVEKLPAAGGSEDAASDSNGGPVVDPASAGVNTSGEEPSAE